MDVNCAANILVIEDNASDIFFLRKIFQELKINANIFGERGGLEGLEFLDRWSDTNGTATLDLILLDVNMPGLNGLDALAEIRKKSTYGSIPIIIVTESRLEADVASAIDRGATSFVTKGSSIADHRQIVRNIADHYLPKACLTEAA